MANCINYDCNEDLGDHLLNECGRELLGGGSGIILFECDTQLTDPTSATEINAEIAAGRATLFNNLKIGLPDPSPVKIDSLTACATQKVINYDRTLTMVDGNVNENNVDQYNIVHTGRSFGKALVYICGTTDSEDGAKCLFIDAAMTATGGLNMPDSNNEVMRFNSTFDWRKITGPTLVAAPVGIF